MTDLQKRTAETFDSYQDKYSDAVNNAVAFTGMNVDFFTRVKADYLIDCVEAQFGIVSDVRALDIGCGIGNYHALLAPRFGKLSGVDVSAASIEKARERHPAVDYQSYDGSRLPYDDNSMDVAFTICVVHHVPPENWPSFFAEMRRVLRPCGMAVVFEHNPLNPLTMRAVNNCPFDEDAVLLRSSKTRELMSGAGFGDIKTRFILSLPAANKFLRGLDGWFSPLSLGAQYYVSAVKA